MLSSNLILLFLASSLASALPRQAKQYLNDGQNLQNEPLQSQQQQLQKEQPLHEKQQQSDPQSVPDKQEQSLVPELPYSLTYLEPQFQYPDFDYFNKKQLYPRVQPQLVYYGPGGQGQPILINPGSPPGNFLVPHQPQPGPNFVIRNTPQRPVFVAGYPKPAHIPPIEKDAEEIPTNPAKIPPLSPAARKPEKLETFNEDRFDYPTGKAGEADVLAAADRNPQLIPSTYPSLKPGHRFFILNGEDLFTGFPFRSGPDVNLKYAQPEQLPTYQPEILPQQKDIDLNALPIRTILLRNPGAADQISNVQRLNEQQKLPENFVELNQAPQQEAFFRSNFPVNIDDIQPLGQFRFSSPGDQFFAFNGDDIENDSVVIDAKADEIASGTNDDTGSEGILSAQKDTEPSTAQAAPGAIALAGPGGVAGAAPRGTALVGRGGLAVSSPQATAVAGTRKSEEKEKNPNSKAK